MLKVLLVDDDPSMVALLKTLLEMEGYQVVTLMDILENIRFEKPEVLLIDLLLGKCNGMDIVKQIRNKKDMKDLKIIVASGIERNKECLEAGADDFLLKPYSPDDLFELLRSYNQGVCG
jgi:DNA-binding response OmpR family regulator